MRQERPARRRRLRLGPHPRPGRCSCSRRAAARCAPSCLYAKPGTVHEPDYTWRRTDRWIMFPWSSAGPVAYPTRGGCRMSIHLVGGGWTRRRRRRAVTATFLAEAATRAAGSGRTVPRIGVLIVVDDDAPSEAYRTGVRRSRCGRVAACEPVVTVIASRARCSTPPCSPTSTACSSAAACTPAYLDGGRPARRRDPAARRRRPALPRLLGRRDDRRRPRHRRRLADRRHRGLPGGDRRGPRRGDGRRGTRAGRPRDRRARRAVGHALRRLVAATEAGLVDGGVAIDECTVLIVVGRRLRACRGERQRLAGARPIRRASSSGTLGG